MSATIHNASEAESRELAETSRETTWQGRSFMRELFLGSLRIDWIDPYPQTVFTDEFKRFYAELERFMIHEVDSDAIDQTGEYGDAVLDGLRAMGAFGMKIDTHYGGLGFTQAEYCRALEMVARYDGNITALLSAHQSIGLPQPLKLFGTQAQKDKYLPRIAKGAISAFALTEADVGSDPARLATTVTKNDDGDYILTGEKLWITNGTICDVMVVMARHEGSPEISAFIVEMDQEGVSVGHRCRFMGLKALANGVIHFDHVVVPKDNLLGKEGRGLKLALVTLNTGRLSLPAACVGGAKLCVEIVREWAGRRVQWGAPVGKHEAIAHKVADIAAMTFGMEALSNLATELSMREGYDIRLEASAAKEWVSTRGWTLMDDTLQVRGGRGFETESSMKQRGEEQPYPVERMLRDSRINRIFEGSSEIMHLFMAREMVDTHLRVAGTLLDAKASVGAKLAALPKIVAFYGVWYPKLWLGWLWRPGYGEFGALGKHLRYVESRSRKLARDVFHAMVWHQAKLEKKQALLFRTVDIAMELAVMSASVVRAHALKRTGHEAAVEAAELAELVCLNGRRFIDQRFRELWANDDVAKYTLGTRVLDGRYAFVESSDPGAAPSERDVAAAK